MHIVSKREVFLKNYTTKPVSEEEYLRWNKINDQSPQGSIYSSVDYLDILCTVTCGKFDIIGVYNNDELVGGIALYEKQIKRKKIISDRLLLFYNGIIIKRYKSKYPYKNISRHTKICDAILNYFDSADYHYVQIHNREALKDVRTFLDRGWNVRPNYSIVVPIHDTDNLWNRIEQNQKRLIKRCSMENTEIIINDDFERFYEMHVDTHYRKGSPVYLEKKNFQRYFELLKKKNLVRLYQLKLNNEKIIASQLVLVGRHSVTHTVCAAADPDYLSMGSTPFLRYKAFEDLSQSGYKYNDLTGAALNEVTRFKAQLGGELVSTFILVKGPSFPYKIAAKLYETLTSHIFKMKRL